MKKIEVIVLPSGESRIEAFGFQGNSCQTATKGLERALGAKSSGTLKLEYYETNMNVVKQKENE